MKRNRVRNRYGLTAKHKMKNRMMSINLLTCFFQQTMLSIGATFRLKKIRLNQPLLKTSSTGKGQARKLLFLEDLVLHQMTLHKVVLATAG